MFQLSSELPPFVNLARVVPPPLPLRLNTPPPLDVISAIVNEPDADIAAVLTAVSYTHLTLPTTLVV